MTGRCVGVEMQRSLLGIDVRGWLVAIENVLFPIGLLPNALLHGATCGAPVQTMNGYQ